MRIKCPHCNGKGFSELNSAVNMTCGWCMGQGELDLEIVPTEPQTEQEYLQTCNTEQLVHVIHLMTTSCYVCGKEGVDYKRCYFRKKCTGPKEIEEWLKQPHKE